MLIYREKTTDRDGKRDPDRTFHNFRVLQFLNQLLLEIWGDILPIKKSQQNGTQKGLSLPRYNFDSNRPIKSDEQAALSEVLAYKENYSLLSLQSY